MARSRRGTGRERWTATRRSQTSVTHSCTPFEEVEEVELDEEDDAGRGVEGWEEASDIGATRGPDRTYTIAELVNISTGREGGGEEHTVTRA